MVSLDFAFVPERHGVEKLSTTVADEAAALSLECPVIDGRRQIQRIEARTSDVGGTPVARLLPSRHRRLIGAWCFLDHIGPARFRDDGTSLHVGAHPHTCLQTFTWMIDGEIVHRDSLGYEQVIRPGQVNLMTAGHGISHTEDSAAGTRKLHGAQLWIALPFEHREAAPRFDHYPELPRFRLGALDATLLNGEFDNHRAPTLSYSPLIGMDLAWRRSGTQVLGLRPDFEYGIVPLEGSLILDGECFEVDQLAYLGTKRERVELETSERGRALLIGGVPLNEEIVIWWNFVAHDKAYVEQAQRDWESHADRFGTVPNAVRRLEPPPIPWHTD